jgi:iron complex outermembrane recepter protein
MRKSKYFSLTLAAVLALGVTLEINARGQTATNNTPSESEGNLQQITVTGYIIPRIGDGPQPVVTLDQDYFKKQAAQTVQDVLTKLSLTNSNFTQFLSPGNNSSPSATAVSLRGLPVGATLTLVDGQRFPSFPLPLNFTDSFVDVNSIPIAAIDRIEILKDGGSATYGDDAVAGVINIILKDNYTGLDVTNYFGISQRGDAETYHGSLTGGISETGKFGKLSIVTAFDYFEQSPIAANDRSLTAGNFSRLSPNYRNAPTYPFPYVGQFTDPSGNTLTVAPGTKGSPATLLVNSSADFNAYDTNFAQLLPREKRYGGLVKVSYSPTDWLKFYDTIIVDRNEETTQGVNQGYSSFADVAFGAPIFVPSYNPYNPTGQNLFINGQILPEFGPWSTRTETTTLRNVVGATLQLPQGWFIDGNFLYGESDATQRIYNSIAIDSLQLALEGLLPGHVGQFFNPFLDQRVSGNFNQAFYNSSVKTYQQDDNRSDLVLWTLRGGGTLYSAPSGDITVAGGLEYRSETLVSSRDPNSTNRNIALGNFLGPGSTGRRYVYSYYGELDIPILGSKWSFPLGRDLDLVLSERYDQYSQFGSAAKPKIAVRYKPFEDLTIRGTYAEGYVVPSLSQLFGTTVNLQGVGLVDPLHPGVPINPLVIQGANPNLKPQNSYSYYLEALWTPDSKNDPNGWFHWLNGLTVYIDWFQIELRNYIATIGAQQILDSPATFPGAVTRGANGLPVVVHSGFQNVGTYLVDGIDFGGSYLTKEFNWGKLDLEANATYTYNYADKHFVGADQGTFQVWTRDDQADASGPDFKLNASAFYSKTVFGQDTFRTGLVLHYQDSEADFINNAKGSRQTTLSPPGFVHLVGSWTTLDYQISYTFGKRAEVEPTAQQAGYDKNGNRLGSDAATSPKAEGSSSGWRDWLGGTTVTFGINNIGDARAPLSIDDTGVGGFDTNNTDPIQRFFYFEIDKKF